MIVLRFRAFISIPLVSALVASGELQIFIRSAPGFFAEARQQHHPISPVYIKKVRDSDRDSDGVEGGVQAAEGSVVFLQESGVARIGRDAGGDLDDGVAGFVDGGEVASAHGSEDGGAVGCSFFGCDEFHFMGLNVGLNLTPER